MIDLPQYIYKHFATSDENTVLVQVAPAVLWIAQTWYLFTFILVVKMVVICDLFSWKYVSLGKKDDLWTKKIITKSSVTLQ